MLLPVGFLPLAGDWASKERPPRAPGGGPVERKIEGVSQVAGAHIRSGRAASVARGA